MQASVHRFAMDPATGLISGSVVTDDGLVVPLAPDVLTRSPLRQLRIGQRVTITIRPGDHPVVTELAVFGVGALPRRTSHP